MSNLAIDRKTNDLIPAFVDVLGGLTNRLKYSEDLTNAIWNPNSVSITSQVVNNVHESTVTDNSITAAGAVTQIVSLPIGDEAPTATTFTVRLRKDESLVHTVSFPLVSISYGGSNEVKVGLDLSTGEYNVIYNLGGPATVDVVDGGVDWIVEISKDMPSPASTLVLVFVFPSFGNGNWVEDTSSTGSVTISEPMFVFGRVVYPYTSTEADYIPPSVVSKPIGFSRVTDGRYTIQLVRSKLATGLGEYLLNPSIGWIDIEKDLERNYDLFALELRARVIILGIPSVQAIQSMVLEVRDRVLYLTFKATTIYGEIDETVKWG